VRKYNSEFAISLRLLAPEGEAVRVACASWP